MQNLYEENIGCKIYITEQIGHEKWKIKINRVKNDQFISTNLYYHKQNQNSKFPNLHLKTLKIILNKI